MNRRDFFKGTLAATLSSLALRARAARPAASEKRPNILLFFTDQQRVDTIGAYGMPMIGGMTPHLDRMALEGVRFANAFTPQPVCGPARACLQTGRYATQTGCWRNGIALLPDEKTMAHWLSDAGYEVGYIGKWHLATNVGPNFGPARKACDHSTKPVPPELRGGYKDFWLASDTLEFTSHPYEGHMFDAEGNKREFKEKYRVEAQTDWVLDYLRTRSQDRPFFLMASYLEPHQQNDAHRFVGPDGSQDAFKTYRKPGDLLPGKGNWQKELPDYLGACHSLDANLGRVRAELEKLGLADNTLIIYTADHSCHFKMRNNEYKRACQDDATHIPLIICGPGFKGGKVVKELASLLDVPSTILAAAGVPPPASCQGQPLQKTLSGAPAWRSEVFIQISESQVGRALRTPQWTYSVRAPGKNGGAISSSTEYTEDFLYDNEKDPSQQINLVRDPAYQDLRARFAEKMKATIADVEGLQVTIQPADVS